MKNNNIIIGNGINLNGDSPLSNRKIIDRIENTLNQAIMFLGVQHNTVYLQDIQKEFDFKQYSDGIETLLYDCMNLVIDKRKEVFKPLTERRLLELLTLLKIVMINAMFVIDNALIEVVVPKPIVERVRRYDNIFSLNYYEFWDSENETVHLHGKIAYQEFYMDDYDIDDDRMLHDIDYAAAIDDRCAMDYHLPINNPCEVILFPIGLMGDKNKIWQLDEKYQQYGFLLLAQLNEFNRIDIYSPLDDLKDITLYGVSPYGDDLLMRKVSNIPKVTVYVHEIGKNVIEVQEWQERVPHAHLIDSKEFLSR